MNESKGRIKFRLITASVVLNVGLLVFFKYSNFFVDNFNLLLTQFGVEPIYLMQIALPIGISFFTFQKLSYSIDVYNGIRNPLKKISDYTLYILLFPQLIAGPIVRFNEIADQLLDRRSTETADHRLAGFYRFIIGLSKKVLIANVMGEYADQIFSMETADINTALAWLGALCYAFQIYFDFAGYSDMAIGLGKMMGFTFPENFDNPYISQNITEFWKRWHITLGRWMRDYLYIPLGGNRVSATRLYINLWVVFLISGLWHGAAWTFIIWGAFHGLFLVLDRLFLIQLNKRLGRYPAILITFIITLYGWIIFRSPDMQTAFFFMKKMTLIDFEMLNVHFNRELWIIMIVGIFFSFVTLSKRGLKMAEWLYRGEYTTMQHVIIFPICSMLLFICASSINSAGFNPFIYFRF